MTTLLQWLARCSSRDVQAILDTLAMLDAHALERAVRALLGASRIECYGIASSDPGCSRRLLPIPAHRAAGYGRDRSAHAGGLRRSVAAGQRRLRCLIHGTHDGDVERPGQGQGGRRLRHPPHESRQDPDRGSGGRRDCLRDWRDGVPYGGRCVAYSSPVGGRCALCRLCDAPLQRVAGRADPRERHHRRAAGP